jgi:hypothetical protein
VDAQQDGVLQSKRLCQRISLKTLIADDLIEGRITLAQAADEFRELNGDDEVAATRACLLFPARSTLESNALQAMAFVRARLAHDPSRCDEAMMELKHQLAMIRARPQTESP